VNFNMELVIAKGRGYVRLEDKQESGAPLGTIAIEILSLHQSKMVKYSIENFRVEQKKITRS